MFKKLTEEYEYLWNWLLNKGIVLAIFVVNVFLYSLFIIVMLLLKLFSSKN